MIRDYALKAVSLPLALQHNLLTLPVIRKQLLLRPIMLSLERERFNLNAT